LAPWRTVGKRGSSPGNLAAKVIRVPPINEDLQPQTEEKGRPGRNTTLQPIFTASTYQGPIPLSLEDEQVASETGQGPRAGIVEQHLKKPPEDAIRFGALGDGGLAKVECKGDRVAITAKAR
jgi:hypothetical protein